ncbi:alpha/beta hydrolase [Mycolicibacterium lacusdiani]|uniref:alpha/beta hydrolase n=1 Tax=Mycolicibacterium lacusdiani TaxID=2895283 RepID=UPI001F2C7CFF|nr:alpha/beta hydrolase [Mycolicibacterium lacusdiani]
MDSEPDVGPEPEPDVDDAEPEAPAEPAPTPETEVDVATPAPEAPKNDSTPPADPTAPATKPDSVVTPPRVTEPDPVASSRDDTGDTDAPATPAQPTVEVTPIAAQSVTDSAPAPAARVTQSITAVKPPSPPSLLDVVGSVIASVVVNLGSLVINTLQALEALVQGPPVLPPGSTVTVRSSTIELNTGQRVAANWYYPEGDVPPTRMILLQHGFLAQGPMYSYTAANLASRTNSIVVTPTLPSNMFAGDDAWLGGSGMASAIADLFVGDRAALTQSAIAAGYATRYGLNPETAALPTKFAMAGHSLGGHLVAGAAGFLAENGAARDLVGVITLDGVPLGTTMPDALVKLDAYELASGHYVPIREIGAPANYLNASSNVKQALSAARPDRFNGVVLKGGVHMDSMQGGNPLIQFAAFVAAGFPQPQNPAAVQELAVSWLDDWFEGRTDVGDDLTPGATIIIPTPKGTARGAVIGTAPALAEILEFAPSGPAAVPATDAQLTRLTA